MQNTTILSTPDLLRINPNEPMDDQISKLHLLEQIYELEAMFLDAASQGDYEKAIFYYEKVFHSLNIDSSKAELKYLKNMYIILNVELRQRIYQTGISPFHFDAIFCNHFYLIDNATSIEELIEIFPYMLKSYCKIANEQNISRYSKPIQHILVTISASLTADLSLSRFANDLFLTPSYLSTLFKKELGTSLTDYVNNQRISEACKMLKGTNLSIQDIAISVGITDIHYFSRLFHRKYAISPSAWRKEHQ